MSVEEILYNLPCVKCSEKDSCGYELWIRLNLNLVKGVCVKKDEKNKVGKLKVE